MKSNLLNSILFILIVIVSISCGSDDDNAVVLQLTDKQQAELNITGGSSKTWLMTGSFYSDVNTLDDCQKDDELVFESAGNVTLTYNELCGFESKALVVMDWFLNDDATIFTMDSKSSNPIIGTVEEISLTRIYLKFDNDSEDIDAPEYYYLEFTAK